MLEVIVGFIGISFFLFIKCFCIFLVVVKYVLLFGYFSIFRRIIIYVYVYRFKRVFCFLVSMLIGFYLSGYEFKLLKIIL